MKYLDLNGVKYFWSKIKAELQKLQTAINGKAPTVHTHTKSQISDFPTSMPANGGNAATVNGHTVEANVPANAKFTDTIYSLPTASASTKGGVLLGYTASGKNYPLAVDSSGKAYVSVPWTDNNTTYGKATSSALGLIMIGYSANGKNYPVVLDSSGKAYVNVPWTDTNTTYAVVTQSANGLMSSADKAKLDGIATGANKTVVDSALSSTSTNPVQNKVINTALAGKAASSHTHTGSQITQDATHRFVTDTEKAKWNKAIFFK